MRKILAVFEVFLGVFEKTKEKKDSDRSKIGVLEFGKWVKNRSKVGFSARKTSF